MCTFAVETKNSLSMANTPFSGMESYINHGHDVVEEGSLRKSKKRSGIPSESCGGLYQAKTYGGDDCCEVACDCAGPACG